MEHQFIFHPGVWLGQGVLTFSYSSEQIFFYTKWIVDPADNDLICAQQQVQKQGENEILLNFFCFSMMTPSTFTVELKNETINRACGKGIVDEQRIAWTYYTNISNPQIETFEGFESYLLQDTGEYLSHAEYTSMEDYKTIVHGKIWRKE